MQILMTTDTVGGVWTYCMELARGLKAFGVQVTLAAKGTLSVEKRRAAASLGNVSLYEGDYRLEWMDDPWEDVHKAGEWLLDLASALQPDVIHLNDYCHAGLPWDSRVLVVGHSCVVSWYEAVRGQQPGRAWDRYCVEVRSGLAAADLVVAPTRHMLMSLERHHGPFSRRRVIPNGCEPGSYHQMRKERFIFSAGRMWDEAKNLGTLAAAAPRLRWPVYAAGLPYPGSATEPGIEATGITWLGALSPREMAVTYARAGIYVLPAVYEPFGLTVLEAALSGCALVLGEIPSLRENWSGAAVFVSPRDPERLADAINSLCDDEPWRRSLAQRAERRGREFTASRMAAAYMRCYRRLSLPARTSAVA